MSEAKNRFSIARALLLTLTLVFVAGPASAVAAEHISLDQRGRLTVRGSELSNRLVLRFTDSQLSIVERNQGEQLTADPETGCTVEMGEKSTEALCPPRALLFVRAGDGNDVVSVGNQLTRRSDRTSCDASGQGPAVRAELGHGRDLAELSAGLDHVDGGSGADQLLGCRGNDRITGAAGADRLSGDRGADSVRGGDGDDWVYGCSLNPDDVNYPVGNPGEDRLRGDRGADYLRGCAGADRMDAGAGADVVNAVFDPARQADRADCGSGNDLIAAGRRDAQSGCERQTDCFSDQFPSACTAHGAAVLSAAASRRR